jgi:hypothetical protein
MQQKCQKRKCLLHLSLFKLQNNVKNFHLIFHLFLLLTSLMWEQNYSTSIKKYNERVVKKYETHFLAVANT